MACRPTCPPLAGADLRALMEAWPRVLRRATDPWAQAFAASVWERCADPRWQPTLKQARIMRQMVRELPRADRPQRGRAINN